jgi:hypothetical protein
VIRKIARKAVGVATLVRLVVAVGFMALCLAILRRDERRVLSETMFERFGTRRQQMEFLRWLLFGFTGDEADDDGGGPPKGDAGTP